MNSMKVLSPKCDRKKCPHFQIKYLIDFLPKSAKETIPNNAPNYSSMHGNSMAPIKDS